MTTPGTPTATSTYADERGRPFVELLARVGADAPATVVDLGCGPGQPDRAARRALAGRRGPRPRLQPGDDRDGAAAAEPGVDVRGRPTCATGRADGDPVDVLVSNATLQWVPGHLDLLPALVARVAPGGWFAFQVPGNFDEPSHTIRAELAAEAPYAEHTARRRRARHATTRRSTSTRWPALGCEVDAWETTYLHVLTGEDPVFTWVSGTGARPTLQALPDDLREQFEEEFKRAAARRRTPAATYGVRAAVPADLRRRPGRRHEAAPRPGRLPARRRGRRPPLLRRRARADRGREARPTCAAAAAPGSGRTTTPAGRGRDPRRRRGPVRAGPQGAPGVRCSTTSRSSRRRRAARRARLRGRLERARHVPGLPALPHPRRPRQPGRAARLTGVRTFDQSTA